MKEMDMFNQKSSEDIIKQCMSGIGIVTVKELQDYIESKVREKMELPCNSSFHFCLIESSLLSFIIYSDNDIILSVNINWDSVNKKFHVRCSSVNGYFGVGDGIASYSVIDDVMKDYLMYKRNNFIKSQVSKVVTKALGACSHVDTVNSGTFSDQLILGIEGEYEEDFPTVYDILITIKDEDLSRAYIDLSMNGTISKEDVDKVLYELHGVFNTLTRINIDKGII